MEKLFLIKKLVNSRIAFYSTVFLAFVPIFIYYSVLSYEESTLTFFVILSIYFLINERFVLAGISAGLSILTKYNGVFILPVLVYILYKKFDKKIFLKNALIITILPLLIALPWFIRNWLVLGNPIWPFLNFIFKGFEAKSYTVFEFGRLFHYDIIAFTYLGFFGVPDGNYALLTFFDIPYLKFLLAIWLIGTLIFIAPLILGFFNNKNRIFILWVSSYLVLFLLYVANVGFSVSRMMLPAFPALAVFWAFGYDKIMKDYKLKKLTNLLLVLIITGFVFTEFVKIKLASDAWDFYKGDFDWVKLNTKQSNIFIANGQCVPYNIERTSLYATNENIGEADYIWINQNFKLDRVSILDDATLKLIQSKNYKVAYSNKKTGTIVYSTRQ